MIRIRRLIMKVKIGVSNHHVHLCQKDFETLFGLNYDLKVDRKLSQTGEFASTDRVALKTNKAVILNVRILGPIRDYTQVEISKTDAIKLGLNPPIRESGDLKGTSPITIVGPYCEIKLDEGCIIASRHIHLNPSEVKKYHLEGKEKVKVKLPGEKGGIIDNVALKVNDNYNFELHLDTDDANAHLIKQGDYGIILMGDDNE